MKIAFLTPEYPHFQFKGSMGGIGTFTKNLAEQLVLNKHTVSVFLYSQEKTTVFVENGITISDAVVGVKPLRIIFTAICILYPIVIDTPASC